MDLSLNQDILSSLSAMTGRVPEPMLVFHDPKTDEVFCIEPGKEPVRAHGIIREMVTGRRYHDPGKLDPVAGAAALADPEWLEVRNLAMAAMLFYLVDFYRPDLLTVSDLTEKTQDMVRMLMLPDQQTALAALPGPYERWDVIIENFIDALER